MTLYKSGLLIIIPYLIYKLIIYWVEHKFDLDINKILSRMIFIAIDIIILLIANIMWK